MPLLKKPTSSLMVRTVSLISVHFAIIEYYILHIILVLYPFFFTDVLHECRLLNNRAVHVISQTEKSMSLKKQSKQYAI